MPAYKHKTRNTWYAAFWYTDWTGEHKKKKKEGFAKKGDALAWEREFLRKNSRSTDMSFRSLLELYRADAEHRVREGTRGTQDSIIDKWLMPYFGDLTLESITAVTVRTWQNEVMSSINPRTGKKYADTYIRSMNNRLSAIFNYAVMYYGLRHNPCKPAGYMGKKKAGKMKFWTLDQFVSAMPHVSNRSFKIAFMIMFWTGLRVGECLALNIEDILPAKTIHVDKTYHRKNGKDTSGPPKTDNSYRDAEMPDFLYDEIQQYVSALYDADPHDRLFYCTKGTLNKELINAAAAAGLPRIRVHDLRHSHAALLVEMDYNIVELAERLGDTVEVAMSTYSHLYPNKMKALAADLNQRAIAHGADIIKKLEKLEKEHEIQ